MISAQVIADSRNQFGNRITTMVVVFPRIILAEFNTHRMFSRNSASSRAIPFEKMVKSVEENPFIPLAWQKDHKGMQGTEYFTDPIDIEREEYFWKSDLNYLIQSAKQRNMRGVTKQLVNRGLELFMYHKVIVTFTEIENFFALRCPQYFITGEDATFRSKKDYCKHFNVNNEADHIWWLQRNKGQAEIHMMDLAEKMWNAFNESTPKELKAGEWHIPFGDNILLPDQFKKWEGKLTDYVDELRKFLVKVATARCARVSYTVVGEEDKKDNYENDIKLHDRLATSGHWSPFEHCAQAQASYLDDYNNEVMDWSGNFKGFTQYRKTFENENIK